MDDKHLLLIFLFLSLASLGLFIMTFNRDKTRLRNGVFFNFFLLFLFVSILIGGYLYNNFILKVLFFLLIVLIGGLSFSGVLIISGLFLNSHFVLKREKKTLPNLLTLLLGLGILGYFVLRSFIEVLDLPLLEYFMYYVGIMMTYFGFSFYNFLLIAFLNSIYKPKLDKDYIIVLGSGLIDGQRVSKLLGSRIDKALEFHQLQMSNKKEAKIIFSGGQGPDEKVSEGQAMADYALEKGLDPRYVIVEDKSRTTQENFKFSKEIMDQERETYKAVFSTSSYHVLRANIYASMVGLDISGIGSKTALYFIPNAIIREYIAYFMLNKKTYLIKVLSISLIYVFLLGFYYFLSKSI